MEKLKPRAQVLDIETRSTENDHEDLRLWLRLLSCTVKIENQLRARLRQEFESTLPRFDLMAQLERNPQGLRMTALSERLMVTCGNITGITDQLEEEKLVVRVHNAADRRVYSVKLTAAGRRAFAKMAAVHEGWIDELMEGLSAQEKGKLIHMLSQLKAHVTDLEQHKE